jgi:NAD(P)-dependent dehydrogenase (short-subunit alcohol dehydrogenase family)
MNNLGAWKMTDKTTSTALQGKIALVTGGATGIGRAISYALAAAGAHVCVADLNEAAAHKVALEIAGQGGSADSVLIDVRLLDQMGEVIDQVAAHRGSLDILVNNAGITIPGDLQATTEENWDAIHKVNLKGSFFCMQAAARVMREQKRGAIINIASISGKGHMGTIAYAASKGGVIAMTRVAAQELGPFGISVNSLAPGFTANTQVMQRAVDSWAAKRGVETKTVINEIVSVVARRRLVDPSEVAAAVVFLASPLATMITGQSINVDGGLIFD